MATIKSYTDINQSKVLAEILPLESADMFYNEEKGYPKDIIDTKYPIVIREGPKHYLEKYGIPCWSLASLLSVASTYCSRLEIAIRTDKKYNVFAVKDDFVFRSFDDYPDGFDNLVDACVTIIEKLNELNLL